MSIEEWIHRAKSGDAAAFNRLVDHHRGLVYTVAYHESGRSHEDAEDACQEAMLSAWRAMDRFDGDAPGFKAWLARIVVNACRDRRRYERRRPRLSLETEDDGEVWERPLAAPGQSPEEYAANGDLSGLLEWAIAQLSADHKTVVLLDHAGFSYGEMATSLGVEEGTIKSRLSRARGHLRELILSKNAATGAPAEPPAGSPRFTDHGSAGERARDP